MDADGRGDRALQGECVGAAERIAFETPQGDSSPGGLGEAIRSSGWSDSLQCDSGQVCGRPAAAGGLFEPSGADPPENQGLPRLGWSNFGLAVFLPCRDWRAVCYRAPEMLCVVTALVRQSLMGWISKSGLRASCPGAPTCPETKKESLMAVESRQKLGVCAAQTGHGRSSLTMLMLTVAIACCGPASRAGVVLFDNLSAGSFNGSFGVTNTQWVAQAFSTTATDYVLDEVSLRLWNQNGTTGNFQIQVWDALGTSGRPGAQVGSAIYTGLAQNLGNSSPGLLTIPALSVALGANTAYYLVARGTTLTDVGDPDESSPGTLYWDATNVNTSNSYDTTNGSSWTGPFSQNLYMKVTAVPEPAPAIMIAAGLAAWAMLRRRR